MKCVHMRSLRRLWSKENKASKFSNQPASSQVLKGCKSLQLPKLRGNMKVHPLQKGGDRSSFMEKMGVNQLWLAEAGKKQFSALESFITLCIIDYTVFKSGLKLQCMFLSKRPRPCFSQPFGSDIERPSANYSTIIAYMFPTDIRVTQFWIPS